MLNQVLLMARVGIGQTSILSKMLLGAASRWLSSLSLRFKTVGVRNWMA